MMPRSTTPGRVGGARLRTVVAACVLLAAAAGAAAEPICKESLGEYYVNIGIANDSFGTGMDDAFEVNIRRMRPSSDKDLVRLQSFDYFEGRDERGEAYPDGRQYLWLKEGKQYRLFKKVGGRKPVRLELFVVAFSPGDRMQAMMRLSNANTKAFNELGLDSRLQVLGVMGVAFRGRHGTVDFINNLKADPGPADSARAYVSNADTMLRRYAAAAGYDVPDAKPAEWTGANAVGDLLAEMDEQSLLDRIPVLVQKQGYERQLGEAMTSFGGTTVSGIKNIRYVFQKCVPSGVGTYGSPRSVFVPIKIKDGAASYYPVFVFPAAFSSTDALNREIWKNALEIRWWNGVAHLDASAQQTDLREALLRYDAPHYLLDVYNKKTPWSKPDNAQYSVHFSLKSLLRSSLEAAALKPQAQPEIPWSVPASPVLPEIPAGMANKQGESAYNRLFTHLVPDLGMYMKPPEGISGAARKIGAKFKGKNVKAIAADLAAAIAGGYALTARERSDALAAALDGSAAYFEYLKPWREIPEADRNGALELIDKIKAKGYSYDDLAWLDRVIGNYPYPGSSLQGLPLAQRMRYLVDKKLSLKNLDQVLADPHMYTRRGDRKEIEEGIDAALKRGEAALTGLSGKKDAKDPDQKKAALEKTNGELAALRKTAGDAFDALAEAEAAAVAAETGKEAVLSAAYLAMSDACEGDHFSPSRAGDDDSLYRDIYKAHLFNDAKMSACVPKANEFVTARRQYRDTVEEQDRGVAVKLKRVHEVEDEADRLAGKVTLLAQLDGKASLPDDKVLSAGGLGLLTTAQGKRPQSWGEYLRGAFEKYLTATGSDEDAFAALDARLKKVPDLEPVYGK